MLRFPFSCSDSPALASEVDDEEEGYQCFGSDFDDDDGAGPSSQKALSQQTFSSEASMKRSSYSGRKGEGTKARESKCINKMRGRSSGWLS